MGRTLILLITMLGCNAVTAIDFCLQDGMAAVVNLRVSQDLVRGGKLVFQHKKRADPWCLAQVESTELYSFEVQSDELYGMSSRVRTEPIDFEGSRKHVNVQDGVTTVVNLKVPRALVSGGEMIFQQQKQADPWCLTQVGSTELYSSEVKGDELCGISSRVRTEPIDFQDLQKHANVAHVQLPFLQPAESFTDFCNFKRQF